MSNDKVKDTFDVFQTQISYLILLSHVNRKSFNSL